MLLTNHSAINIALKMQSFKLLDFVMNFDLKGGLLLLKGALGSLLHVMPNNGPLISKFTVNHSLLPIIALFRCCCVNLDVLHY